MNEAEIEALHARYGLVWRWIDIFRMLSMDRVEPLLGELGIDPAHGASWRTVARQFTQAHYAYADEYAYDGWPIELGEALLQGAWDTAARLEGAEAAASLYTWGEGTHARDRSTPDYWWIWSLLLVGIVDPLRADYDPPTALNEDKLALLQQTYAQLFALDTHAMTEISEPPPLSKWDTIVCDRYWQWMDDPGHITSPLDSAAETIRYRRMRDLWAVLKRHYNDDDFAILLRWGRQIAPRMRFEPDDVQLPP